MNNILTILAQNCTNEEYVIGDALLELIPVDFIKPSELGGSSVRICCEEDTQLETNIVYAFLQIAELISSNKIIISEKKKRDMIGSYGLMRLKTDPKHVDRLITIPTTFDVWDVLSSHYTIS